MQARTYSQESVIPADDVKEYSSFVADIDLIADLGQPVRLIQIITAGSGSIVVETKRSAELSLTRTLTGLVAGDKIGPCQINKIMASGTNVTKVRVYV